MYTISIRSIPSLKKGVGRMRRVSVCISVVAVCFSLMMIGCAKEPKQEFAAAKSAVDAAKAAEADKYASQEFAAVQDSLSAAVAEIAKQKTGAHNFTKAKATLVFVTSTAAGLKAKAAEQKAIAETDADNAIAKLSSSIADGKALLAKQPKNKKTKVKIEEKQKQIAAVESTVAEIQKLKGNGDFIAARDKANAGVAKIESLKVALAAAPVEKPSKVKAKERSSGREGNQARAFLDSPLPSGFPSLLREGSKG